MRASAMLGVSASIFATIWAGAIVALLQRLMFQTWFWTEPGLVAVMATPAFIATGLAAWWQPIRPKALVATGLKTAVVSSLIFSAIIAGTVLAGILINAPAAIVLAICTFIGSLIVSLPCATAGAAVFELCVLTACRAIGPRPRGDVTDTNCGVGSAA